VLVWTDMAGMRANGSGPKFVKPYADVRGVLLEAAQHFADDVKSREYPDAEHSYT